MCIRLQVNFHHLRSEPVGYAVKSADQNTEFRIRESHSAQPENINYVGAKRHHSILTPDFWLLNSEFQHRLSLKVLSKGQPKPGPLGQDSLLTFFPIR